MIWLVFATLMLTTAIWQAQVAAAKDAQASHKTPPPPAKTRHAIRPTPAVFSGDVIADYIARCEKGLTDQEIGWILEDFRNAGLDLDIMGMSQSADEYAPRRAAQDRWYHDALVEGFHLSATQSDQVTANLSKLFDTAKSVFDKAVLEGPPPSEMRGVEAYARFTSAQWYLSDLTFMPWKLCSLTPTQEKLTWKSWTDKTQEEQSAIENRVVTASERDQDPLSRVLPYPAGGFREYGHAILLPPVYFQWPNLILPFLNQQKFIPIEDVLENQSASVFLSEIRALQPAQLKLLLLFEPERRAQILRALNGEPPFENSTDPFGKAADPSSK